MGGALEGGKLEGGRWAGREGARDKGSKRLVTKIWDTLWNKMRQDQKLRARPTDRCQQWRCTALTAPSLAEATLCGPFLDTSQPPQAPALLDFNSLLLLSSNSHNQVDTFVLLCKFTATLEGGVQQRAGGTLRSYSPLRRAGSRPGQPRESGAADSLGCQSS